MDTALTFARQTGRPITRPEILGLLSSVNHLGSIAEIVPVFTRDLVAGNETSIRKMVYELFYQKASLAEVFDQVMRPVLRTMEMGRHDGSVREFERRRGQSMLSSILNELRSEFPPIPDGPVACGANRHNATLGLCSQMVELLLRTRGWNAFCLGASCPVDALIEAGQSMRPNLVWYTAAEELDQDATRRDCDSLARELSQLNIPLFLGTALAAHAPNAQLSVRGSDSFVEFQEFLGEIHPPQVPGSEPHSAQFKT